MTNGGFIQFYWNGYDKYLPAIKKGLELIGDITLLDLVDKVENEFLANVEAFKEQWKLDDWEPLYDNLHKFDEYDTLFYEIHDRTMGLIEKYARENPTEFGVVK